jgi:hypothetical protein
MIEVYDNLDVVSLSNGKFVWQWTGPGGAWHQGAQHYDKKAQARRAGRDWLKQQQQQRTPQRQARR